MEMQLFAHQEMKGRGSVIGYEPSLFTTAVLNINTSCLNSDDFQVNIYAKMVTKEGGEERTSGLTRLTWRLTRLTWFHSVPVTNRTAVTLKLSISEAKPGRATRTYICESTHFGKQTLTRLDKQIRGSSTRIGTTASCSFYLRRFAGRKGRPRKQPGRTNVATWRTSSVSVVPLSLRKHGPISLPQ